MARETSEILERVPSGGVPRTVPDRSSPVPLWAQLHGDLLDRVEHGEFDDDFPGELELAAEYAVSRNTVREAMRHLRSGGVVIASRGRRPRVASATEIEQPLISLYSLFASVEASGLEQRSVVRSLEVRNDPEAADHLGIAPDRELFYLERLRLAGGEPLALDRVWMAADLARPLLQADFSHAAFYDLLAERTGTRLTGGREQIRAVVPDTEERALLRLDRTLAALSIDRLGFARDRPVEWRRTLVRGDRFSAVADFSARSGYRIDVTDPTAPGVRPVGASGPGPGGAPSLLARSRRP
jgi:GntR family transcriptional regulator